MGHPASYAGHITHSGSFGIVRLSQALATFGYEEFILGPSRASSLRSFVFFYLALSLFLPRSDSVGMLNEYSSIDFSVRFDGMQFY